MGHDIRPDLFLIDSKTRKGVERRFKVFFFFQHLAGINDHVVNKLAVGKYGSLDICDLSPLVGQALILISLLRKYLHRIGTAVVALDQNKPECQQNERCHYHQK